MYQCITYFLLEMLGNSVGGFLFLHPLVRFLDRPGVHELGKQHAVMAAWVASWDFETPRTWPLPPKLTRISGEMIFVDWIGWQFLDVFLSYFGGIQVGIWKNQDFAKHPYYTQSRRTLNWLTKGIRYFSQTKPTSSFNHHLQGKHFYYLDSLNLPPAPCFPAVFCFFRGQVFETNRPSRWKSGSMSPGQAWSWGRNSMPSFSQGPVAKPWIEDPKIH